MLVKCISNTYETIQESEMLSYLNMSTASIKNPLSIKKEEGYLVVAYALGPIMNWYYLDTRCGLTYPTRYPAQLFKVIDNRPSMLWVPGISNDHKGNKCVIYAPEAWALDGFFHGKLFEGDTEASLQYKKMLNYMRLEYRLPWIKDSAISLNNGNWVTDKDFSESWEINPEFEMTIHPMTQEILHCPVV